MERKSVTGRNSATGHFTREITDCDEDDLWESDRKTWKGQADAKAVAIAQRPFEGLGDISGDQH
jgi:hypothetical protein